MIAAFGILIKHEQKHQPSLLEFKRQKSQQVLENVITKSVCSEFSKLTAAIQYDSQDANS